MALSPIKGAREYGVDLAPMERVNLNPVTQQARAQILLTTPEFEAVAEQIAAHSDGEVTVAPISWARFPDQTPNLFVPAGDIRCRDVIMLADMSNVNKFFDVLSVIYSVPRYLARTFTLVIPFIPVATMERVDYEGQVSTAKVFADVLSNTPRALSGNAKIVIFDIHALQERFYFTDNVHLVLTSAVELLLREFALMRQGDKMDISVCFPDDGAKKRYGPVFEQQGYDTLTFSKMRVGDKRFLKLTEGDPKGRHVCVVDDLCQSGGTLMGCKDELEKLGATKVSAFVTHGVFPKDAWRRFTVEDTPQGKKPFDFFFVTDTVPCTAAKLKGKAPFKVLSIGRLVTRLFNSKSRRDPFSVDLASEHAGEKFYEAQRDRFQGVRTQEQWGPGSGSSPTQAAAQ
eukprot:TRINITY_DN1147_c0_g1_i1.p1 TRINITY_DN1147_c0_g1~~TRINITY_DN1147_c0_g1_i1.p1  ORF type:complete len:413 (+),score=139.01 TRINITY_DN1147_c0_g1_i1:40-1239(+)